MAAADLDAALGRRERVLLDSSTLVAYHSPGESVYDLAQYVLECVRSPQDPLRGYYSVVSASELLVRPIRTAIEDFTYMYTFITEFPGLTLLPVELPVALMAANLRAITTLRLPDTLVVACGLLAGCQAIVSNDQSWKRHLEPLFREFRWICLSDYL